MNLKKTCSTVVSVFGLLTCLCLPGVKAEPPKFRDIEEALNYFAMRAREYPISVEPDPECEKETQKKHNDLIRQFNGKSILDVPKEEYIKASWQLFDASMGDCSAVSVCLGSVFTYLGIVNYDVTMGYNVIPKKSVVPQKYDLRHQVNVFKRLSPGAKEESWFVADFFLASGSRNSSQEYPLVLPYGERMNINPPEYMATLVSDNNGKQIPVDFYDLVADRGNTLGKFAPPLTYVYVEPNGDNSPRQVMMGREMMQIAMKKCISQPLQRLNIICCQRTLGNNQFSKFLAGIQGAVKQIGSSSSITLQ